MADPGEWFVDWHTLVPLTLLFQSLLLKILPILSFRLNVTSSRFPIFCFFFEAGFLYEVLAVLELPM